MSVIRSHIKDVPLRLAHDGAWYGNRLPDGPIITDSHSLFIKRGSPAPALCKKLAAKAHELGRTATQEKARELFDKAVAGSDLDLTLTQIIDCPVDGWPAAPDRVCVLRDQVDSPYYLNAYKLRLAFAVLRFDGLRGSEPTRAVVLFRDGKPVGVVMPLRQERYSAPKQWWVTETEGGAEEVPS